jgi:16S rRNA (uracil1498-N3)-methyltransferase
MNAKVRLYVDHPLAQGQAVPLTHAQAHYLFSVMRLGPGAPVALFNGRDGEWRGVVAQAGKRGGILACEAQTAPLRAPPDLWLIFAPVKKARTDFIVEKAVELGAARIMPVQTRFTNADRWRQDKQQAHAVEAAEQCGATVVPEVADILPLDRLLTALPADRNLMWCDESLTGQPFRLSAHPPGPWAILIGPEGGFADTEQTRIRALPQTHPISLGPRTLRADTAALAALVLWQAAMGDWV